MVPTPPTTVDAYLASLPAGRQTPMARMRAIALGTLKGFAEGCGSGLVFYRRGPDHLIAFSNRAQYIALYAGEPILSRYRKELTRFETGRGCVRFRKLDQIDWELVQKLFRAAAA